MRVIFTKSLPGKTRSKPPGKFAATAVEHIRLDGLLKATPVQEGEDRILYFEASNEDLDHQNEVVLQKALADSAEYYLRHGNLDLSHYTLIGPKSGIADFMAYEIGKPIDVSVNGVRTFVKAELYRGESPMAKNANMVWESLTKQSPPSRWYPSVGGSVLAKSTRFDPSIGRDVTVVEKVRWNNIALDRCPVNATVPEVGVVPVGVFAKSMGGFVLKGLEAGYGTDSATLTGGAALRTQSLHGSPISYFDFRGKLADMIRSRHVSTKPDDLVNAAIELHAPEHEAERWVGQFLSDIKSLRRKTPLWPTR